MHPKETIYIISYLYRKAWKNVSCTMWHFSLEALRGLMEFLEFKTPLNANLFTMLKTGCEIKTSPAVRSIRLWVSPHTEAMREQQSVFNHICS